MTGAPASPGGSVIGTTAAGEPMTVDLDRLVGSHACIVANSGGGKSGLVRRLLETTHGRVQHIVLDGEDEFYTLRERFEYVIAGGEGGDAPATPANAASLAIGALEHGFSLIAQLNDLGADGAPDFIGRFLAALVHAPRRLWHPVLVVVDEAQRFVPRLGATAATEGVLELIARGRKRGFTFVGAGTKLSEIDPRVRGGCNNWMLGRVGQALDRRTMADQLGFTGREARELRGIEDRHFWAFGPALSREPVLFRVADVETTPVRAGQAKVPTPPAPEALRTILQGLAAPVAEEAGEAGAQAVPAAEGAAGAFSKALNALEDENRRLRSRVVQLETDVAVGREVEEGFEAAIAAAKRALDGAPQRPTEDPPQSKSAGEGGGAPSPEPPPAIAPGPAEGEAQGAAAAAPRDAGKRPGSACPDESPRTVAQRNESLRADDAPAADPEREYRALAALAAVAPAGLTEAAWAARSGYSRKGGAWNRRLTRYRRAELVEQRDGKFFVTAAGLDRLGADLPSFPAPGPELVEFWARRLGAPGRILRRLGQLYPQALKRSAIAGEVGMSDKGGAFNRHMTALKSAGVIEEQGRRASARIRVARVLMEEAR